MYDIGIFIFRRDLRLNDNHGLINLLKNSKIVIPIFILDKYQIIKDDHNKYYFSNNVVQFMCESLEDLNNQLINFKSKLRLFHGNPAEELKKLIKELLIQKNLLPKNIVIGYNADYSKYSTIRDNNINNICKQLKVDTIITHTDYTLNAFELLIKKDGSPFKQYGAFFKNAIKNSPTEVTINKHSNYWPKNKSLNNEFSINNLKQFYNTNINIAQHGGRKEALHKLNNIKQFKDYNLKRDILSYNTTNLSAALNFGCISIRETYEKIYSILGKDCILIKQLYWRDFYLQAIKYFNNANDYNKHLDSRYENLQWKNNKSEWLKLWHAQTGFLLIDAAMNEMKITGFMHNRARMLVGVFWTKYLIIDTMHPKYGSHVGFSSQLVDAAGCSQNLMNHRWILDFDLAGRRYAPSYALMSGRPMDISNKMIKKWDPNCSYIKKWLPQFKNIPNKDIFNWNKNIASKYNIHPSPMFDSKEKYQEWINVCKN